MCPSPWRGWCWFGGGIPSRGLGARCWGAPREVEQMLKVGAGGPPTPVGFLGGGECSAEGLQPPWGVWCGAVLGDSSPHGVSGGAVLSGGTGSYRARLRPGSVASPPQFSLFGHYHHRGGEQLCGEGERLSWWALSPPPWGPCCRHCAHTGSMGLTAVLRAESLFLFPALEPPDPSMGCRTAGEGWAQPFVVAQAPTALTALPGLGGVGLLEEGNLCR